MSSEMFFHDWAGILRVAIVGGLAYVALIVVLRTAGQRTLAKLNAFDLVVTVALGSILGTILLSNDVALVEGVVAMVLLVSLQWLVTTVSVRSVRFAKLVRSEPTLLVRNGQVLRRAMASARVTEGELSSIVRRSQTPDLQRVAAVILESDGSFSVIDEDSARDGYPTGDLDLG